MPGHTLEAVQGMPSSELCKFGFSNFLVLSLYFHLRQVVELALTHSRHLVLVHGEDELFIFLKCVRALGMT
eukprot:4725674-Prorocentrum_lima.AAC.1